MIAVDTNILVRILVEDPDQPAQTSAARELASKAKQVFVPLVVQVETVWVLESGYKLHKENVAQVLEHLEVNQAFILENEELCQSALELYRSSNVDYSDCIILTYCRTRDLNLYTFDKRLSKLASVALLKEKTDKEK